MPISNIDVISLSNNSNSINTYNRIQGKHNSVINYSNINVEEEVKSEFLPVPVTSNKN